MKINDLCSYLEQVCPLSYQESYDNCGLLVGSGQTEITKALLTLDCTEEVIEEAIEMGCNLIIAHHPIIFAGLKKLTGATYIERTVIKAIQNNIAIYAIHTNLDNILGGVNSKFAERLGLTGLQILDPKAGILQKLVSYVPKSHSNLVLTSLFEAGAGSIGNYSECSFASEGLGSFKANTKATPFIGEIGKRHLEEETKLEVVFPSPIQGKVVSALLTAHPYEEVAYDIFPLLNKSSEIGSGLIGELPKPMEEQEFLAYLKEKMDLKTLRYTRFNSQKISKVAICGGAGSFLLKKAISQGAQAFISSDFKYHEFFDAENRLLIADIGHYESEKFTKSLLSELILEKFPTFAILLSKTDTNPVNYYL
ncbi:MAG: Nif3-like dinuclear metal center hexameric protein [Bacteroidetes bacterium B1(2017)]|nr:MAG: Nif3-like dinuclear metal center hexameric protein [Bacteroidetes bacterium B1(2017)]